jgi:hypothetical protein
LKSDFENIQSDKSWNLSSKTMKACSRALVPENWDRLHLELALDYGRQQIITC